MYDVSKEFIFFVFVLVLATIFGAVIHIFFGLRYGLLTALTVLLLLTGGALFHYAETNLDKLVGSIAIAAGIGIPLGVIFGSFVGVLAFLILLACCLAFILWSWE